LKSVRTRIRTWENLFLDMPDETNGVNNAVSCSKEAVQFRSSSFRQCLPVFDEICGMATDFVFFVRVSWDNIIKILNTPLDRSAAALDLSVLSMNILQLDWHPANLDRNLAGAGLGRISKEWLDSGFSGAGIRYNRTDKGPILWVDLL